MKLYEWIVFSIFFVKSRPSPYFQLDDMFYVECIPTVHLKNYLYYGNASTYIDGSLSMTTSTPRSVTKSSSSLLVGQCEVWKRVVSDMTLWAVNNNVTDYWTYPDEFMNHNNCRNFDLTQVNDDNHHHLTIHMKIIKPNASSIGPWCYAYDHVRKKYYMARCFPECAGNDYQDAMKPPPRSKILATADTKLNYNAELIDWITIKRPSNIILSAEFEKNRYSIFFAMIAVGMIVMICSISFVTARNYIKIREKRMKQEGVERKFSETVRLTSRKAAVEVASSISMQELKLKKEMGTPI